MGAGPGRSSGVNVRRRSWAYRGEASPWFSPAIAAAATVWVFATAFLSMTSLHGGRRAAADKVEAISISLAARPLLRTPTPPPRPIPRRSTQATVPANALPPTVDSSSAPTSAPRDSGGAPPSRTADAAAPTIPRGVPMPIGSGSKTGPEYAPAWVAAGTKVLGPAGSAKLRDSISDALSPAANLRAWARPMSAGTRGEIDESRRQADLLDRRMTTAGNSRDVHVASGSGVGGVGAIGVGGSVGVPFFSRGPSAAQRARDAKTETENRAIMQRLAERARAKRDSIRRDSIRADSARIASTPRRPS
jgi:hypothetical protein